MAEKTKNLHFYNNAECQNGDAVLLFLRPREVAATDLLQVWEVLQTPIGTARSTKITTSIAAEIAMFDNSRNGHGYYTCREPLPHGQALQIVNPDGPRPIIGKPGKIIGNNQVGLQNKTAMPAMNVSIRWFVSGNQVIETNNTDDTALTPGEMVQFEIKAAIYLALAPPPRSNELYTKEIFDTTQEIPLPDEVVNLYFEVCPLRGTDTFKVITKEQYEKLLKQKRPSGTYQQSN